jgi:nucleoid-associated protein YgaU
MEKARILKLNQQNVYELALTCQFNPENLSFSKQNSWKHEPVTDRDLGRTTFASGQPATLKAELFFDTTGTNQDVRIYTDILMSLMLTQDVPTQVPINYTETETYWDDHASEKYQFLFSSEYVGGWKTREVTRTRYEMQILKKPPASLVFLWGQIKTFAGFIKSVDLKFIRFQEDGTPVRARASVTLQQHSDERLFPPQNPTSRSLARKMYQVTEGETLDWIAYKEYGDASYWRHIANTNQLSDPRDLRPGQILRLFPLP